uniref:DUF7696 family protein n=1 Tax=Xanthomonas albilineans TaxID=29447 RepID=UPI0027DC2F7C|nr:hypothetical protein [Xanthomonas albilineans]
MSISCCLGNALAKLPRLPESERDAFIATLPACCMGNGCTTGMGCRDYVASVLGSAADQRRRMCEARHYLRRGYTTGIKVKRLIDAIALRRGQAAAEQLRAEMRAQWARRREWLA